MGNVLPMRVAHGPTGFCPGNTVLDVSPNRGVMPAKLGNSELRMHSEPSRLSGDRMTGPDTAEREGYIPPDLAIHSTPEWTLPGTHLHQHPFTDELEPD